LQEAFGAKVAAKLSKLAEEGEAADSPALEFIEGSIQKLYVRASRYDVSDHYIDDMGF
jgi:hypothetical protein